MAPKSDEQHLKESGLELLESEQEDLETSPPRYEIVTYPADFTLENLVAKYKKGQIRIPGFQRKYVWRLTQASKLVESFLLGLPVPAIFLYTDPEDNSLQVIDGQQRLLSVAYFFSGYFGPEERGKRTVFALAGLNEKSPYQGKTYELLQETDPSGFNQLNDAVLRAFVIKQLNPSDDTGIYHVFERLNTGGTQLVSQEIRNCVYHGVLNELLGELNRERSWRKIFGKPKEDRRQRDIELILRFLALFYEGGRYERPMKDFLSRFMNRWRDPPPAKLDEFREIFERTTSSVLHALGEKPFHIRTGLNAAVFDAVFVAFATNDGPTPKDIRKRYDRLVVTPDFLKGVSSHTTDTDVVRARMRSAAKALFE